MFSILRKKIKFFTPEEKQQIKDAILKAEQNTSGEVRVFVESRCSYMDAIDRAAEIFLSLKMEKTELRNGVLVYLAMEDHQVAVFGDEGIHQKVGNEFWDKEVKMMVDNFTRHHYSEGITQCVLDIGDALHAHFPYDKRIDKNELPDDIVFGS